MRKMIFGLLVTFGLPAFAVISIFESSLGQYDVISSDDPANASCPAQTASIEKFEYQGAKGVGLRLSARRSDCSSESGKLLIIQGLSEVSCSETVNGSTCTGNDRTQVVAISAASEGVMNIDITTTTAGETSTVKYVLRRK